METPPPGFEDMLRFGLVEALLGRRSRRFFRGAEIPDGVFAYRSRHPPMPLSELETLLVVAACGGTTGWHHLIARGERYAPHLSNYAAAAGGRTFPSAAGFHCSVTLFTDDSGVYVLEGRDAPGGPEGLGPVVDAARSRIRKVEDGRLGLPPRLPHVEAHNTWVVNQAGTLLVIPVADVAQHLLLALMYLLQNGIVIRDDHHGRDIPGVAAYADLYDADATLPLSFVELTTSCEIAAELATSCFAGALMLQAMGLGGWMFDGVDPFAVLGASGDPAVPGLRFRYDADPRWPTPNPTGRAGVLEAPVPPHVPDMAAAVDLVCRRKFGPGGPFHPDTPGPFRDTRSVRSAAQVHDARFRACVALQAQYVLDTFGRFPASIPSVFASTYLQAFHLDLDFYDRFHDAGSVLHTHRSHLARWHGGG